MSKLPNIIQRRELEPLLLKALKIVKHYEKAANCEASVMRSDCDTGYNPFNSICAHCGANSCSQKKCAPLHLDAVNKARKLGGSYIYICPAGLVFWTSPFYSGERFAGALVSGGVRGLEENSGRVKALAQLMLICADQISGMSFLQKSVNSQLRAAKNTEMEEVEDESPIEPQPIAAKTGESSPLDLERMLLASLRRGDKVEGQKILANLLKTLYKETKNNFPAFRLKAMELAVLLSRAVSDPKDIKNNSALDTTNRCFKKIEGSSTLKEITETLSSITERMSGMIFSFHGVRHFSALRKAERYIWDNYTKKLSLKEIAQASGLSAPYFSTIFKEEMGENLTNYLNRLRVEKAAAMLVTTNQPISEIAIACGFEDQSWFSKIFKNNTGLTPGKCREQGNILS